MPKSSEIESLSRIIDILVEELGEINPRGFHGYGSVQPYYTKSTREMLGYVEHEMDKEKKGRKDPVKISRAFLDQEDEEEV